MELAYWVPRILLTIVALGYGFITMKADFNATHATNPRWTPHARFHVVWQVLSYSGIAIISLGLIWLDGPMQEERLYLVAALGGVILLAFFAAALARPLFGGTLYDDNGYPPFPAPVGRGRWDVNMTVFTTLSAILIVGTLTA